jgi:cell shape-determining protein MreC
MNFSAEKNENDEIRKLRQQVKELNELVTAKKENRSENSSLALSDPTPDDRACPPGFVGFPVRI